MPWVMDQVEARVDHGHSGRSPGQGAGIGRRHCDRGVGCLAVCPSAHGCSGPRQREALIPGGDEPRAQAAAVGGDAPGCYELGEPVPRASGAPGMRLPPGGLSLRGQCQSKVI